MNFGGVDVIGNKRDEVAKQIRDGDDFVALIGADDAGFTT